MRRACVLVALAILAAGLPAPAASAADHPIRQWSLFERALDVDPAGANPFDIDQIDVHAVFAAPDGRQITVAAFWFQDFARALIGGREQLTPRGSAGFRVRFTPTVPGRWTWSVVVRRNGGPPQASRPGTFIVTPAHSPGFVRVSRADTRYLSFDDGSPYFAVGENLAWYDARGTFAYDDWLTHLAAQHVNYIRVWMPSWAFGLEWNDTGLGNYTNRLDRAWQLDYVLRRAEQLGIYVDLVLLNHGAFSTTTNSEWAANPYNVANGGMLRSPSEFFTNTAARDLFVRRLRYVVARWSWSTHLLAWELWNEVDLTDNYDSATVAQWHHDMSWVLRALDPNQHLVTTSHAFFFNDPMVWNSGLDFTQIHFYSKFSDGPPILPDVASDVVNFTHDRLDSTNKPVLFGELGVDSRGPDETRADDPSGIGVHLGLWSGIVSGGVGTAMTWWWDNLIAPEGDRYYPMFGAAARFVDGVAFDTEHMAPQILETRGPRPATAYAVAGTDALLVWMKDAAYNWDTPTTSRMRAKVRLPSGGGEWCGAWYDTSAGRWEGGMHGRAGSLVRSPAFTGDVALRAHRC